MVSEFFSELRKRNRPLYWFGWLNVLMLLAAAIMFFLDDTFITGVNAWTKPMKFAISVTIYAWTFAWLLYYLPSERNRNFISWGVIICMLVENTLIFMQAGRGVRSHFNVQTVFDGVVFTTMGLFILINSFIILYTLILFFSKNIELENPTMLWAWRLGLAFFFLGGISGVSCPPDSPIPWVLQMVEPVFHLLIGARSPAISGRPTSSRCMLYSSFRWWRWHSKEFQMRMQAGSWPYFQWSTSGFVRGCIGLPLTASH